MRNIATEAKFRRVKNHKYSVERVRDRREEEHPL